MTLLKAKPYLYFRFFYLLSLCETGYRLPSEIRLREALRTLILAMPGISLSMIIVESIKILVEKENQIFGFYCGNARHMPLQSMMTVRIVSPFMLTLLGLELVMHIFIQVLARKLDVPRGTVILMENQVVTRRMHRRLVISETGYFISTIFRCILALIIISTMDQLHYIHIGKLIIFCGPSIMFFVIPMILTLFSSEVRSSISQCLKYFRQEIR